MNDSTLPELDLDPVDLAEAILSNPQAAESARAFFKSSRALTDLVRYGHDPRSVVAAATAVADRRLAVHLAVVRYVTEREFYAAHPEAKRPKAMAPESHGALKMRVRLSKTLAGGD